MTGSLNSKINVMVVGGGGREHALCWKIAQSKFAGKIYCAPGNGGTAADARITNINLPVTDFAGLTELAQDKNCLLYTSPSPRDGLLSRMPSSA